MPTRNSGSAMVLRDERLLPGSKALYFLLDEFSRERGYCWPAQSKLANILNCCERMVRYRLEQLEECGHIAIIRGSGEHKTASYYLAWAGLPLVTSVHRQHVATRHRQFIAGLSGNPLPVSTIYMNPDNEPCSEPQCQECYDAGWVASEDHGGRQVPCGCVLGQKIRLNLTRRRA